MSTTEETIAYWRSRAKDYESKYNDWKTRARGMRAKIKEIANADPCECDHCPCESKAFSVLKEIEKPAQSAEVRTDE